MLVGTQKPELIAALYSACPTLADFDLMLSLHVNQWRERLTTAVGMALPSVIAVVVDAAEREFWTTSLIAGLVQAAAGNADVQAFIARNPTLDPRAAPAPPVNHYAAEFLVGRRVFLSRPTLRTHLRDFGRGLTSRVLVVNGPRGSGKTYSKTFIGYLLAFDPTYQAQTHDLRYVDLDAGVTDLETLALGIGAELGLPAATLPPRPMVDREQKTRWTPLLRTWLINGIKANPANVLWLVIDGSHLAELSSDEADLIDALGDFADNGGTSKLRLVLINYTKPGVLPFSLAEQIPDAVVGRGDVEQFIATVYGMSGKSAEATRVTQAVDEIFRQVKQQVATDPTQPHRELALLSQALTRAANQLLG